MEQLPGRAAQSLPPRTVGIVFQAFSLVPSLTAFENVVAPLSLTGTPRRKAQARAAQLLERVGLADRARHRPGKLGRSSVSRSLARSSTIRRSCARGTTASLTGYPFATFWRVFDLRACGFRTGQQLDVAA